MISVRAQAVRWVDDEPFPGWVEVHLPLADGTRVALFDKPPVFGSDELLRQDTVYPVPLTLDCEDITATARTTIAPGARMIRLAHNVSDPLGRRTFLVSVQSLHQ